MSCVVCSFIGSSLALIQLITPGNRRRRKQRNGCQNNTHRCLHAAAVTPLSMFGSVIINSQAAVGGKICTGSEVGVKERLASSKPWSLST